MLVVYGGAGIGSGTLFGDTWEWNGRSWEERNVRRNLDDIWEWDGVRWKLITP